MSLVQNVNLQQGEFKLEIPRLEILDQGLHLVQGPSGCGKSTLLRVLLGLTQCQGYSWMFKGIDLSTLSPGDRRIGIVFQNLGLFPHMTAEENICFAAKARGVATDSYQKDIAKWAELLKMQQFLQRKVSVLSGGEKQRVAFVRALMSEPRILFLDEPFSNLDQDLKAEGRQILTDIKTRIQIPVFMVSHDGEDAKFADKITRMENGKVVT